MTTLRKLINALLGEDSGAPPITDAEVARLVESIQRPVPAPVEPPRKPMVRVYDESFADWLRRTAQPGPVGDEE